MDLFGSVWFDGWWYLCEKTERDQVRLHELIHAGIEISKHGTKGSRGDRVQRRGIEGQLVPDLTPVSKIAHVLDGNHRQLPSFG